MTYELMYLSKDEKVPSKLYSDRDAFIADFQKLSKSDRPFKAQGPDKNGKIAVISGNGWDDDDVVLTVDVNFGSGKKYSYQAEKRYSGLYNVETLYGQCVASVTYRWRQIDEFRAAIWEAGYDEPASFESILIGKVVK